MLFLKIPENFSCFEVCSIKINIATLVSFFSFLPSLSALFLPPLLHSLSYFLPFFIPSSNHLNNFSVYSPVVLNTFHCCATIIAIHPHDTFHLIKLKLYTH